MNRPVLVNKYGLAGVMLVLAGLLALLAGNRTSDVVPQVQPPVTMAGNGQRHAREMLVAEIDSRFRSAIVMLHAKEHDHAITALHRVLELAPRMPEAHVNMGFALLGARQPAVARDFFLSAIELRPAQVNAYWGLAESLELLCDYDGAKGAMRSYIHLTDAADPYLPKARAALWEWEDSAATGAAGDCTPASAVQ